MKIFSAIQTKECDKLTIQNQKIHSNELMEHAAVQCAKWITNNFTKNSLFIILCGPGNNGGDGLAITRILHQSGIAVKPFLLNINKELSQDCAINLDKLKRMDEQLVTVIEPNTFITDLPNHIIIIDAIFGTGLTRPIEGWVAQFIHEINLLPNTKIAIDLPSGMFADSIADTSSTIFKVDYTLSFQWYKRSFLHPESQDFIGIVSILDIGLDQNYINSTHTNFKTIDFEYIKNIYKPRKINSHKGDYGHVLLIGGSYGKIGAMQLCCKAALCSGAGLVTTLIPDCGYISVQTSIPEIMCITNGIHTIEKITGYENKNAIGVGPGLGTENVTFIALTEFLDIINQPIVLDADALNIISKHPELLAKIPKGSILTPHPKEFSRLFGENTNSMIQTDNARIQAMRYGIYIVLKNHNTTVITPEGECWYNTTGNAGMATAGSGDVLTGIITGLLAQKYASFEAALMGVYLHGLAGDLAAKDLSQEAMVSGDIIQYLGKTFLMLKQ